MTGKNEVSGMVHTENIRLRQHIAELETTLQMLQALVENAPDTISVASMDRTIVYANPAFRALTGYGDELVGMNASALYAEPDEHLEQMFQALADQGFWHGVLAYRRKDGNHFFAEVTTFVIQNIEGQPYLLAGIAHDITEQLQMEAELHRSQSLLSGFIQHSPAGIFIKDLEGRYVLINDYIASLLHRSPEQIVTRLDTDFFSEEVVAPWRAHEQQVIAENRPVSREVMIPHDGVPHIYLEVKFPLYDAQGNISSIGGFATDITERKQTEETLRLAQFSLDRSADGVQWILPNGQHLYVNDAICHWLGYTREELLTMHAYDISAAYPGRSWEESWELVKRHGSLTFETRARCKNGRILPVEATVNYLEFNDKEYLCAFVRNITERNQMEQMLRETNDELRLRVAELEQRNRDMSLLTEMSEGLQGCQTVDDAYQVFARIVPQLFEHQAGALYLVNVDADESPGEVVAWGAADERVQMCDLSRCLAFQEGRARLSPVVEDECLYSAEHQQIPYMCIPLTGHDDIQGILQIALNHPATEHERERQKRLATTVADHFALALTNLRLHEQLREQAIRDALTGLFNRRYLEDTLMRELRRAARHRQTVGVILIDIDHFKQFNTTYGLAGGDATLRAVGKFLQQSIRHEDIACRYGGEEFTLILPGSSRNQTRYRAEELRRAIKHVRAQHEGRSLGAITISLGVASYPDDGITANEVLGAADHALGIAKQQGRDQVVLAVPVEVSPEQ